VALRLRPFRRSDLDLLAHWLSLPHVERWWREPSDRAAVEARYGPAIDGTDPTLLFVVELEGEPIGFAQSYLLRDNAVWAQAIAQSGAGPHVSHDAASIDYFIGVEGLLGRGLGGELIELLVGDTFRRQADVSAVTASVAQENRRSWRALEKAGFERVWAGEIVSDDPSDEGPSYMYVRPRQAGDVRRSDEHISHG
jgi:aminoglycoside 6'-N-acetyltransferase